MRKVYDSGIPEEQLSATDNMHHIPYKKRSFYRAGYHYRKNGRLRAMDYPRELFSYEDETYHISLPARELLDRDEKYSGKYKHGKYKQSHVCWKNEKKNKRQWMKHHPAHAERGNMPW